MCKHFALGLVWTINILYKSASTAIVLPVAFNAVFTLSRLRPNFYGQW